jgi:hypothetical protein
MFVTFILLRPRIKSAVSDGACAYFQVPFSAHGDAKDRQQDMSAGGRALQTGRQAIVKRNQA